MLERLEVKNLAVLESVALEFGPGLTVLSGETGAGKSVLVDALSLLLGERAEGMTRAGAETLLVTAWFEGRAFSRRVSSGRSTPRLEGEVISLRELAEEAHRHMSIHAQHAALSLPDRRTQRRLLDSLLDPNLLLNYAQAYKQYQDILAETVRLESATRERERRLDVLRFQLNEIDQAKLGVGEESQLEQEAERLRHQETLRERVGLACNALSGDGDSLGILAAALKELRSASRFDPSLEGLATDLHSSLESLQAVARELEDYLERLEADPRRLEDLEARLVLIEKLQRKYGPGTGEVLRFAEEARKELHELGNSETRLGELVRERERAWKALLNVGKALSHARQGASERLSSQVVREIRTLGMMEARFSIALGVLEEPGEHGLEEVAMMFSANPGLPEAPLEKPASGGELSRVMLALALITGTESDTVVFDEIDSGIGGEAAWQVAERLAKLAQKRQVLVVTHLPQIAARAQTHYRVLKVKSSVEIEAIQGEERVRELARMLSGSYSETALEHARELLGAKKGGGGKVEAGS
jgi:DNA repair protein RecN (Recombination protein N)